MDDTMGYDLDVEDEYDGAWWIYLVYTSTLAPWGVIQVHDAIDYTRRPVHEVRDRLILSTVMILASTIVGVWYVVWAAVVARDRTESATMLVGVVLNAWHWVRLTRGWYSFHLLMSVRPAWEAFFSEMTAFGHVGKRAHVGVRVMSNTVRNGRRSLSASSTEALSVSGHASEGKAERYSLGEGWHLPLSTMEVNDTVIDNDYVGGDRSVSKNIDIVRGVILWRMVWVQGVDRAAPSPGSHELSEQCLAAAFAPGPPPDHGEKQLPQKEALDELIRRELIKDSQDASEVGNMHVHSLKRAFDGFDIRIRQRLEQEAADEAALRRRNAALNATDADDVATRIDARKRSLEAYSPGQQDHVGEIRSDQPQSYRQYIWEMMTWITSHAPKPMENIWYESKELTIKLLEITTQNDFNIKGAFWPSFPSVQSWFRIAGDIARQRDTPLLLSVLEFKRFALRMASSSALLTYSSEEYAALAQSVYELGILARWTHGWSGRLSCYSSLWTPGHVGMALLGGLSLLAIRRNVQTEPEVRCLLVGTASETIMARFMPDRIRAARTDELALRYSLNKGKTCRGSGVKCVREACQKLGLPRSSSQLDGAVAFAVGWAKEAIDGLPGNQKPRDGNNHEQIEEIFCSSRAYRFTDERL